MYNPSRHIEKYRLDLSKSQKMTIDLRAATDHSIRKTETSLAGSHQQISPAFSSIYPYIDSLCQSERAANR